MCLRVHLTGRVSGNLTEPGFFAKKGGRTQGEGDSLSWKARGWHKQKEVTIFDGATGKVAHRTCVETRVSSPSVPGKRGGLNPREKDGLKSTQFTEQWRISQHLGQTFGHHIKI